MLRGVKMGKKGKIIDLFDAELSDGSYIQAWKDNELTFFTIRFVTLAIPNDVFKELLEVLGQHTRNKIDNSKTGVV